MSAALWGQLVVKAIIVGVLLFAYVKLVLWIAYKLNEAGKRAEETERLRQLLILADAYEVAPTEKDRTDIYKRATELGFTDDIPFALDPENHEHPTLPRAS